MVDAAAAQCRITQVYVVISRQNERLGIAVLRDERLDQFVFLFHRLGRDLEEPAVFGSLAQEIETWAGRVFFRESKNLRGEIVRIHSFRLLFQKIVEILLKAYEVVYVVLIVERFVENVAGEQV